MDFSTIRYEKDGHVLTITLHRPERMNAFTFTMADELIRAIDLADADGDIRAVILTGAGRAFCAGADLEKGQDAFRYETPEGQEPDWDEVRDAGGKVALRFFECRKPMIAAINGPAVGVGATITLPADIRLAAEGAKMGFVFCARGIAPDGASSWFLPKIVGLPQALEWVLTARVFPAEEALRAGLVRSLHAPGELLAAARRLADEIAANVAPVSATVARQMIWRMAGSPHPVHANAHETRAIYWRGRSEDVKEGVMSFLEKRPAKYSNRVPEDLPPGYPWWGEEPEFR
ncbi:enoyl-CoA hydratase [Solimonas fluminis]|uniref:Enoyl-CoA hydratase n=1 Tax=Solimonas fluminis TaxID=2086571 RepID=A0A2S5TCV3_9GAMM|nr:crotonase/enoyl-CoA hydratase family protein [Solimonas fluminis]PPE72668.1 enoyl-CoA hydratase [Solimonas fluminis]